MSLEKTCYDLMDQCSTGTTSHQHYRPPHQVPGHDLVIDLDKCLGFTVLTGSGSGNRMPQRDAAAVPLGVLLFRDRATPCLPPFFGSDLGVFAACREPIRGDVVQGLGEPAPLRIVLYVAVWPVHQSVVMCGQGRIGMHPNTSATIVASPGAV